MIEGTTHDIKTTTICIIISQFQKKYEREMSLSPFYSVNKSSVFKLG